MRRKLSLRIAFVLSLSLIVSVAKATEAQTPKCPANPIEGVILLKESGHITVEIILSVPIANSSLGAGGAITNLDNVIVVTKPSGTTFTGTGGLAFAAAPSGFGNKKIAIRLAAATLPAEAANDKDVEVTLKGLDYNCSPGSVTTAKQTGKIYDKSNIGDLRDAAKKALEDAYSEAKTSDEKNLFAGFTVAKGEGSNAAGAGDISINKTVYGKPFNPGTNNPAATLFDKAIVSLQIKKSTAENADPKHFDLGLTFQKRFLLNAGDLRRLQTDADSSTRASAVLAVADVRKRRGFFRSFLIDETLKMEGEAFEFDSVNFVSDTQFQLASIVKKLGGGNGFWNMKLITGPELGRNLQKPEATTMTATMMEPTAGVGGATAQELDKVNWIARFKGGAKFALRYLPVDNTGASWGIEFDTAYVYRYLFRDEVVIEDMMKDMMTNGQNSMKVTTVDKGKKDWFQADFKIFLFSDEKARYGIKASYNRGSLPPAFTPTKGFNVGFVIETTDDRSNGSSANQLR